MGQGHRAELAGRRGRGAVGPGGRRRVLAARAEAAGLLAIVDDAHKPRPTTGIVLAIGEDPLAQELYKVGDIVMYSPHAGQGFRSDHEDYRSLELHEIIGVQERQESHEL